MLRMMPQELIEIDRIASSLGGKGRAQVLAQVKHREREYGVVGFSLGSTAPDAPVLGLIGGVHGLEKIGSQVAITYFKSILERMEWDATLRWELERLRLIFVPVVNPVGMLLSRRSNGNHVDLMRNSPVVAEEDASFLIGGQRYSKRLPWYRGGEGDEMEAEARGLCDFIRRETFESPLSIIMDLHSGFGFVDQLWFPFANSKRPFPQLSEIYALKLLLDRVNPYHVYRFEPQAKHYTTHGDLWDYLYDEYKKRRARPDGLFLPLTLEMGSWLWIKKNPWQLFSFLGPFNPVKPHRQRRTLRRHVPLFDFLVRALVSSEAWARLDGNARDLLQFEAMGLWYPGETR